MEPEQNAALNDAIDAFFKALPTEPEWRNLHRLADRMAPDLRKEWLKALAATVKGIPDAELRRRLRRNDVGGVLELVRTAAEQQGLATLSAGFLTQIRTAYEEAGRISAARLVPVKEKLPFAVMSNAEVDFIAARGAELIRDFNQTSEVVVRRMLEQIQRQGIPSREAARMIRSTRIGLNARQQQALENFAAKLEQQGLAQGRIRQLVAQRKNTMLDYRARMIVDTETMRALNAGHREAWRQAVDAGRLDPGKWQVAWTTAQDLDVDPDCQEMEGRTRDVLADQYPNGTYPPPLHPNCRCIEVAVERNESIIPEPLDARFFTP